MMQWAQTEIQEIPFKLGGGGGGDMDKEKTLTFLTVRVVQQWNRLPRQVVDP